MAIEIQGDLIGAESEATNGCRVDQGLGLDQVAKQCARALAAMKPAFKKGFFESSSNARRRAPASRIADVQAEITGFSGYPNGSGTTSISSGCALTRPQRSSIRPWKSTSPASQNATGVLSGQLGDHALEVANSPE